MKATARCAGYQRRVAGAANDFIGIPATLVHIGDSQTAEGCDDSDIGVTMLSRKAPDRLGPGSAFSNDDSQQRHHAATCRRLRDMESLPVRVRRERTPFQQMAALWEWAGRSSSPAPEFRLGDLRLVNRRVLAGFLRGRLGIGDNTTPPLLACWRAGNPPVSRCQIDSSKTTGIGRTLALETQRLADCNGLFRRGQIEQAQASFRVAVLRDLAERQSALDGRPFAGTAGRRRRATSHRSVPTCRRAPGDP